jgi:hypothetical protein
MFSADLLCTACLGRSSSSATAAVLSAAFESEELEPDLPPFIIMHCPKDRGVAIFGTITKFQERRGGLWVDVQRWIDAA